MVYYLQFSTRLEIYICPVRIVTILGIMIKASFRILLEMLVTLEDLYTLISLHISKISASVTIISCNILSDLIP